LNGIGKGSSQVLTNEAAHYRCRAAYNLKNNISVGDYALYGSGVVYANRSKDSFFIMNLVILDIESDIPDGARVIVYKRVGQTAYCEVSGTCVAVFDILLRRHGGIYGAGKLSAHADCFEFLAGEVKIALYSVVGVQEVVDISELFLVIY
jgi:hypothetical protein